MEMTAFDVSNECEQDRGYQCAALQTDATMQIARGDAAAVREQRTIGLSQYYTSALQWNVL
jgi:hypothetical protein